MVITSITLFYTFYLSVLDPYARYISCRWFFWG